MADNSGIAVGTEDRKGNQFCTVSLVKSVELDQLNVFDFVISG